MLSFIPLTLSHLLIHLFVLKCVHATSGTFLHITDIHLDVTYVQNSDPDQLCHRQSSNEAKNIAGKYGTLGSACDSPISLVQSTFEYLKRPEFQEVDFIIYTGDTARHDRDKQQQRTYNDVLTDHKTIIGFFNGTFDLTKTKLIPTIGNLDVPKHNDIDLSANDLSSNKILVDLRTIWSPLQLNLDHSFSMGGSFAQDIPGGPIVLSVNSMYFFTRNKDIPDCDEPGTAGAVGLSWLQSQLASAADNKRQVYIMSHVPPLKNDKILYKPQCYLSYVDLLGKYSDIIAAHLTGHTNEDQLAVLYSNGSSFELQGIAKRSDIGFNAKNIKSVLTNAPSIIPRNNPGFRMYHYDTADSKLQGWDQYWTNLDEDNAQGSVTWSKEYSTATMYGVGKLDTVGWQQLISKFKSSKKMLGKYQRYLYAQSRVRVEDEDEGDD